MCFISSAITQRQISEKPITVYKIMGLKKEKDGSESFFSLLQEFHYQKGREYQKIEGLKEIKRLTSGFCINEGFHSYGPRKIIHQEISSQREITLPRSGERTIYTLVKCTIPTGAVYYKNIKGDFVSDKIIIDETVTYITPSCISHEIQAICDKVNQVFYI